MSTCEACALCLTKKKFVFTCTWRKSRIGSYSCGSEESRFDSATGMTLNKSEHLFMPASTYCMCIFDTLFVSDIYNYSLNIDIHFLKYHHICILWSAPNVWCFHMIALIGLNPSYQIEQSGISQLDWRDSGGWGDRMETKFKVYLIWVHIWWEQMV